MAITHKAKAGALLTGTEYEAADAHEGTLTAAEVGAAPDDANYLVGTASAGLSAEIAVGTTPGGELGGTWASPTVDVVHAGATAWADYTPTLTASVSNPVLGSSTLTGRWKKLDANTIAININLIVTTGGAWSAGSGAWSFALPAGITSAATQQVVAAHILDSGTDNKVCVARIAAGSTKVDEIFYDAGNNVTHSAPVTWATNDSINISGILEIA